MSTPRTKKRSSGGGEAAARRREQIVRHIGDLASSLTGLSPRKAADAKLLDEMEPHLRMLRDVLTVLLGDEPSAAGVPASPFEAADQVFDEGMDLFFDDRKGAAKSFRRALELDPLHADAHSHLGLIDLEANKVKAAERHFRAAVEGGERHVVLDGGQAPWGILENRPLLRALANLALALEAQGKWAEAVALHRRVLALNPDDNQGIRYVIGVALLNAGEDAEALRALEACAHKEVGCAFGLALARLRTLGPSADVGEALLLGFAANRYVAPMLLAERWTPLDGFHGTNMAEPSWAADVVEAQAELWDDVPAAAEALRFWWRAPAVAAWRKKLDATMVALGKLPVSRERDAVVEEQTALRSEKTLRDLARAVLVAS